MSYDMDEPRSPRFHHAGLQSQGHASGFSNKAIVQVAVGAQSNGRIIMQLGVDTGGHLWDLLLKIACASLRLDVVSAPLPFGPAFVVHIKGMPHGCTSSSRTTSSTKIPVLLSISH